MELVRSGPTLSLIKYFSLFSADQTEDSEPLEYPEPDGLYKVRVF